ncbi:MAG TPA: heparinase II/III family protein [Terriglobales bacterium]|jgi:Heparinase II/III-like protein|nr:heparinase II/III family protein [Terriglobales bacterium]
MKRRDFIAALAASALTAGWRSANQIAPQRPRLLITDSDPFTGLPILKTRYSEGRRPSDDLNGWALAWQLTGQDQFAERALAQMRSGHISATGKPSRSWVDYVRWSLAFDWLFSYRGFDDALKRRIAGELKDGAAAMLSTPDFADPGQFSYHNYAVRYLSLAAFASAAVEGYPDCDARCRSWHDTVSKTLANVLETTDIVSPAGSYHESLDYMRITWASLVLIAEMQRTTTGVDPAQHFPVFRNMGDTYLYKLLPDGTPSREGDNEYPVLDNRDTAVLGYAINRFKDPYSAWLLRKSGFLGKDWVLPVLEFLWDDPAVSPRDPAQADEQKLPHQRFFPGVGHLVMRDGWKPDSTWIEFDCGPYFAKHQHLDQNQFTIYRRGYLAIDSGADYTDTESPHYLNYYRRSIAHNTVLIYDPKEKFFWSDNLVAAANDGGQRMDSARYWNSIRSREDWNRTRDLWDLGSMKIIDYVPGQYQYAIGDASKAYSSKKLRTFTRELLYLPSSSMLFVYDRVVSTDPSFRKSWLLHGVNEPTVDRDEKGNASAQEFRNANTFRFREGSGELLVYSLLPKERLITRRGGAGNEFYAPGNDNGGAWGTGENWPLEPPEGAPLPQDPKLRHMWKMFWGDDFDKILSSNRKNVVPGAWRIEVSPSISAVEDHFLHVLEIGDEGKTGKKAPVLIDGANFQGAVFEGGALVLFSSAGPGVINGEASLPDMAFDSIILTGLEPNAVYEIDYGGLNVAASPDAVLPGVQVATERFRANTKGILKMSGEKRRNLRMRVAKI